MMPRAPGRRARSPALGSPAGPCGTGRGAPGGRRFSSRLTHGNCLLFSVEQLVYHNGIPDQWTDPEGPSLFIIAVSAVNKVPEEVPGSVARACPSHGFRSVQLVAPGMRTPRRPPWSDCLFSRGQHLEQWEQEIRTLQGEAPLLFLRVIFTFFSLIARMICTWRAAALPPSMTIQGGSLTFRISQEAGVTLRRANDWWDARAGQLDRAPAGGVSCRLNRSPPGCLLLR